MSTLRLVILLILLAGAAGVSFTLLGGLPASGSGQSIVYEWGDNANGQLGNGTTVSSNVPIQTNFPAGINVTQVAGGYLHSLGLTSTGQVYAWGDNSDGELGNGTTTGSDTPVLVSLPAGVTVTKISAGYFDSLAVTAGGQVYAWGENTDGQLGNGTVSESNTPVLVSLPAGVTVDDVAAAFISSYAVTSTGQVYSWGDNSLGELGNGTTTDSDVPVLVNLPAGVTANDISAGYISALAMTSTGQLYAWGDNSVGELGDGTNTSSSTPVLVSLPAGVTVDDVAAGYSNLAVTTAGQVYAWGDNAYGELGDGTTTNSSTPVLINLPGDVTASGVAVKYEEGMAATSNGGIYAWGDNTYGQLGNGTTVSSTTPVRVTLPSGVTASEISAGSGFGLALTTSTGTATQLTFTSAPLTGSTSASTNLGPITVELDDALGNPVAAPAGGITVTLGSSSSGGTFSATSGGSAITSINMGASTSTVSFFYGDSAAGHALLTASAAGYTSATQIETISSPAGAGGQVYAWGDNSNGELGNCSTTNSTVPVEVSLPAGVSVTSVAPGSDFSLAVTSTGQVYAWGDNSTDQLGDGTSTSSDSPVLVSLPAGVTVTEVAAGLAGSMALTTTGQVYTWGEDADGELGNGTSGDGAGFSNSDVPVLASLPAGVTATDIAAGSLSDFAVTSTGQVYGWGFNGSGQLGNGVVGDGTSTQSDSPVLVSLPAGVTAIGVAAGNSAGSAATSTGQVYAWGNNLDGELGDGTTGPSAYTPVQVSLPPGVLVSQVAEGNSSSEALTPTGQVYSWGDNSAGELGDGTTTDSDTPVLASFPPGITVTGVTVGADFSYGLTSTGQIYAWGDNSSGELGNGTTVNSDVPVLVSLPPGVAATDTSGGGDFGLAVGPASGATNACELGFTSSSVTGATSSSATLGPITVQLQDTSGNPVAAPGGGITVDLESTSAGGVFSATSGGTAITSIAMASGTSTVSFFYGDIDGGDPTLTATATGYTSATQTETISTTNPATKLAFATSPVSGTTSSRLGPITISLEDAASGAVVSPGGVEVQLSSTSPGGTFTPAAGGAAVTAVIIEPGASSVSFFYADAEPGTPTIAASASGYASAVQSESIGTPASSDGLAFDSTPVSGPASSSANLGPITVIVEDGSGEAPAPAGGVIVELSTSSGGGVFSGTEDGTEVTSIYIPAGSVSATFYYGDSVAGSPLLTAFAVGYTTATQSESIEGSGVITDGVVGGSSSASVSPEQGGGLDYAYASVLVTDADEASGEPVAFEVTSGPDAGQTFSTKTNAGKAIWVYQNNGELGTDAIAISITDSSGVTHQLDASWVWTAYESSPADVATLGSTTGPPNGSSGGSSSGSTPPGHPGSLSGAAHASTAAGGSTPSTASGTSGSAAASAVTGTSGAASPSRSGTDTGKDSDGRSTSSSRDHGDGGRSSRSGIGHPLCASGQRGSPSGHCESISPSTQQSHAPVPVSPIIRAIPKPSQISFSTKLLLENATLALILLLLVALPAEIFNSTLSKQNATLTKESGRLGHPIQKFEAWLDQLPNWLVLGSFASVGALLYCLVDPTFGFSRQSAALLLGLIGALALITIVHELIRNFYLDRTFHKRGRLKAFPLGILIAAILVLFSRLAHFEPGYMFGVFAGLSFRVEPTIKEDGRSLAITALLVLGLGVGAWFLWIPISDQVAHGNGPFVILVLDALLATTWVAAVQSLLFSLIPLKFLDGEKVVTWNRLGWFGIYLVGMFVFVQAIMHPQSDRYGGDPHADLRSMFLLFSCFMVAACLFWLYFRLRVLWHKEEEELEPAQVGEHEPPA